MSESRKCSVITFGNFKGGAGKTTNSVLIAYALSAMGYKVLLSDQDPQANATKLLLQTKINTTGEPFVFDETLMTAIMNEDLGSIVTEIKENLFVLPSYSDFFLYPNYLEQKFPGAQNQVDRVHYFASLLEPLKKDFDFIFIDLPPTISIISDSALYASDYVVVSLQTQRWSLDGAETFIDYLRSMIENYNANLEVVGILPVLFKNGARSDLAILEQATDLFGKEHIFEIIVKNMERLKGFVENGITNIDRHDRRVHDVYQAIAEEFLLRYNELEGVNMNYERINR